MNSQSYLSLDEVTGISYGPNTMALLRHQDEILNVLAANRDRPEERRAEDERLMRQKGHYFAWECVSLLTKHRTYDFVIRDRDELLLFVNAVTTVCSDLWTLKNPKRCIFNVPLFYYKLNMIKMKIAYQAFLDSTEVRAFLMKELWKQALLKIMKEKSKGNL